MTDDRTCEGTNEIDREDSEIFEQIAEQVLILEQLGDARQSEIERAYRRPNWPL